MERLEMVEKLKNKVNVSYEEAKVALEKCNWDILDAVVYLEDIGIIKKPSVSTYFTNEYKENTEESLIEVKEYRGNKKDNIFETFFETICRIIDKGNNIFFIIKRRERTLIKLPITVMILLITVSFWVTIPLFIVGLFFEMEYSLSGYNMEKSEFNKFFNNLSNFANKIKNESKRNK